MNATTLSPTPLSRTHEYAAFLQNFSERVLEAPFTAQALSLAATAYQDGYEQAVRDMQQGAR